MGQAAQRAKSDPSFGRIPKRIKEQKRGLVVSPPITIEGTSVTIGSPALDPQELRYSLLFWDDLVLPQNNLVHMEPGHNERFLIEAGALSLRRMTFAGSGDMAAALGMLHIEAFRQLDAENPGVWSLATGPRAFSWNNLEGGAAEGFSLDLLRAIPVPNVDVPLQEVLEFKQRRRDELLALRAEIDSFVSAIETTENAAEELQRKKEYIEKACADLLAVGIEWRFPVRIADLKCSFELNPGTALAAMVGGYVAGATFAMPTISAIVSGAASVIKITGDLKLQAIRPRATPYQYVYDFHADVF